MNRLDGAIFCAGWLQFLVLIASAMVPFRLDWKATLAPLPKLVRQLFWVYGGYVVLSICALGTLCVVNSKELAQGELLARSVCGYGAAFWGVRCALQAILDPRSYLTTWWLIAGYHLLTVVFLTLTAILACGTFH
ncbi:MAG: hypothetical protein ACKV0T_08035 [Planctomycetales bacterium]